MRRGWLGIVLIAALAIILLVGNSESCQRRDSPAPGTSTSTTR